MALGRALHQWRTSLVADLGGPDAVSTQQLALLDLAVCSELLACEHRGPAEPAVPPGLPPRCAAQKRPLLDALSTPHRWR